MISNIDTYKSIVKGAKSINIGPPPRVQTSKQIIQTSKMKNLKLSSNCLTTIKKAKIERNRQIAIEFIAMNCDTKQIKLSQKEFCKRHKISPHTLRSNLIYLTGEGTLQSKKLTTEPHSTDVSLSSSTKRKNKIQDIKGGAVNNVSAETIGVLKVQASEEEFEELFKKATNVKD